MAGARANDRAAIAVLGLWHLGCVIAACLAEAGNDVVGIDPDPACVEALAQGRPPIQEPGLDELVAAELAAGRLRFTSDPQALSQVDQVWVAFDTPVDDDDRADVDAVLEASLALLAPLRDGALVVVSSQLPVGSVAELERRANGEHEVGLRFACVPENLRLGQALESFRKPDRIVIGVRSERDRDELAATLVPFSSEILSMRVESAEMTKHALNGFLATSVAFINEVAAVCEAVGADASEVSAGLKSERRIGPRAYLSPGDAFAGGTLARDVAFMRALAARADLPSHVFTGVAEGNAAHRMWQRRKLLDLLGDGDANMLEGANVAVWGLTYKPGTDTLRRSSSLELCQWMAAAGAAVRAHDPAVHALPPEAASGIELCGDALEAATDADALVVATAWPQYREIAAAAVAPLMRRPLVIDAAGFLAGTLGSDEAITYVRVGTPRAAARGSSIA